MIKLYKYLSEPFKIFEEGYIRLTQHSVLNDPFEASFCAKSLDSLFKSFDEGEIYGRRSDEVSSASQYVDKNISSVGIISFSKRKDNLLMWAHYGNNHKGIAAGLNWFGLYSKSIFEQLMPAECSSPESSLFDGIPKAVSYEKSLTYQNTEFDYDYSSIYEQGADRFLYDVFMQKSEEWIYEQEYRVVLLLQQADRVIVPSLDFEKIKNEEVKRSIANSGKTTFDGEKYTINLNEFDIEADVYTEERAVVASELASLSNSTNVIYLMKLDSSLICSCVIGERSDVSKESFNKNHVEKTGYFDIFTLEKNKKEYTLDFKLESSNRF